MTPRKTYTLQHRVCSYCSTFTPPYCTCYWYVSHDYDDAELDELLEKATASLTQRKNQELQEIKKLRSSYQYRLALSSHVQTSATGAAETIHIQPMKTTSPPELELSAKEKKKMEKVTAGPGWFGMVSTDLTDQVKQDCILYDRVEHWIPNVIISGITPKSCPKYFSLELLSKDPQSSIRAD
ncbi:hypothetical protein BASA60_007459 [Batrachochytrium salamandrivorans]|nr:hypothetical protein BASA60_007459 [Batrachochytrium salamandrivorans]